LRQLGLPVRLFHAELGDIYTQDFFCLLKTLPLGTDTLKSDFRLFNSRDVGQARGGKIDNLNIGE
jgi:hypothetical protein